MTTRRRHGQLTPDDVLVFSGVPKPDELIEPQLRRIDAMIDEQLSTMWGRFSAGAGQRALVTVVEFYVDSSSTRRPRPF
jgi:hypothetical protein